MSEIRATTISDETGNGPIALTKQSAAKAWGNINGTGTAAIRDSFGVSSITDIGTGYYQYNFTNAMDSADNFSASAFCRVSGQWGIVGGLNDVTFTASSFKHATLQSGATTSADALYATMAIHGDLA